MCKNLVDCVESSSFIHLFEPIQRANYSGGVVLFVTKCNATHTYFLLYFGWKILRTHKRITLNFQIGVTFEWKEYHGYS